MILAIRRIIIHNNKKTYNEHKDQFSRIPSQKSCDTEREVNNWYDFPIKYAILTIRRKITYSNRDENGEWRRLQNEELHSLYRSSITVRVIKSWRLRWSDHVARMKKGRSSFKILTGKPTGKRPFGRPRRWYEGNIRIHLK